MLLTDTQVQRFKQIILKSKGIKLTDEEALDQATRLLKLARLVMLGEPEVSIENQPRKVQDD